MSDPLAVSNPSYFNNDYRADAIGVGGIWFWNMLAPIILYAIVTPGKSCDYWGWCWWWNTKGTWHAWNVMRISYGLFFGFTTLFWALAWIKKPIMQKIYYRVIAWFIPASWIFAFWTFLAFMIGGGQNGGNIGYNFLYWFIFVALTGTGEVLAWWRAPNVVKYYRWDEQSWWNYKKDEAPQNWPEQLWDFEDY